MTSSRDYDVIPRDQHFLKCSMAHAKRLSTTQYKPHLSTVFRLAYTSFRKCMGNTVSIYIDIYIYLLLQNQKVCWLLTYHDSFISTLQIYAQKKNIKDITPIFITLIRPSHLTDYQRD